MKDNLHPLDNQKGIAHILLLIAAVGLVILLVIIFIGPFNKGLFQAMYPKPPSKASTDQAGMNWGGITMFLNLDGSVNSEKVNQSIRNLSDAGVKWARIEIDQGWYDDPEHNTPMLQALQQHGIQPLITLRAKFDQGSSCNEYLTIQPEADYEKWVTDMVTDYKTYVKYWEIENEPNLHWVDDSDPTQCLSTDLYKSNPDEYDNIVAQYVQHLQDGYQAVHQADPDQSNPPYVLIGGISEDTEGPASGPGADVRNLGGEDFIGSLERIKTTKGLDASQYFDIFNYHPYSSDPDSVMSRMASMEEELNKDLNFYNKPIWITEVGYNCYIKNIYGSDSPSGLMDYTDIDLSDVNSIRIQKCETQRAQYLTDTMNKMMQGGNNIDDGHGGTLTVTAITTPIFWYQWNEWDNQNPDPNQVSYGLVYGDPTDSSPGPDPLDPNAFFKVMAYNAFLNAYGLSPTPTPSPAETPTPVPLEVGYFNKNNGVNFYRSSSPYTSGVATQTVNGDGNVTVSVNNASSYSDSGFVPYGSKDTLGQLTNITVTGSGDQFGLNIWFDTDNDQEFFNWGAGGLMSGLGGDTYAIGPTSVNGTLTVDGSTTFHLVSNGQNYTLSQLQSGAAPGINANTHVAEWIGVDVNRGSASATIQSISGL